MYVAFLIFWTALALSLAFRHCGLLRTPRTDINRTLLVSTSTLSFGMIYRFCSLNCVATLGRRHLLATAHFPISALLDSYSARQLGSSDDFEHGEKRCTALAQIVFAISSMRRPWNSRESPALAHAHAPRPLLQASAFPLLR